ncbi:MAG: S41 family peptidase [Caulobacter sp.]|nr:S41 family peptidase [Caulobacter sp.]
MKKNLLIGACAFVMGAGAMAYVGQTAQATAQPRAQTYRLLELFGDVLDIVQKQYVTEVDDRKLIEAALDGMVSSLDPHSGYLAPDSFEDMQDTTRGEYGGLGIEITSEDGVVKIIAPMDGTPASRAGLQSGDYITAVDGQSVIGMPTNQAVKLMRGAPGEKVTLTIAREKTDPFDVSLVREVIKPKSAVARMEGDYGYVRLSGFNEKATDEVTAAIKGLQAQNPKMKGLVFDLRNNPGGLLDQAVGVANIFLDGGEVVSQRGRAANDIERYNARAGDMLKGLPVVVLVNSGSASAAEIVAGALQDRKRAEIVGLTSFGKGSVQTVIPLRGGADGALKLTTARYFTPSGRSIQRTGIEPDLEVASSREQAQLIATRSFQYSEASLRGALDTEDGSKRRGAHAPAEAPPASFDEEGCKKRTTSMLELKCDFQLQRGLDVLRNGSVAATPKLPKPSPQVASVVDGRVVPATGGDKPK